MKARVENDFVEFSGYLSEKSNSDEIRTALLRAAQASQTNTVRIDFSGVDKANSVGILTYLKVFETAKVCVVYERAPVWLVEQFNCIQEFFSGSSTVTSLYARFIVPGTEKRLTKLLTVGKEVPVLADYKDHLVNITDDTGALLEADFDPELYFSFLTCQAGQKS
jgi:ABC-type transporter Mla MlaB component